MKAAICQRARELGFDDCRVTTAVPPESARQLQRWLAEGRHGQMSYLERNAYKRREPQAVLPGAKSIITLAVNYAQIGVEVGTFHETPEKHQTPNTKHQKSSKPEDPKICVLAGESRPTGFIARYARFDDYHKVLADPLKGLTELVNQLGGPGTRSLWYVDTGPVLERDLAQRAGLGFIGKHTNVISRRLGNWIFLAEILTTLELEPDTPEKNRCGNCLRCIAACPTGAITAPFQLDARRCISYLTIELRGSIPLEFRSAIGNRIYGCDDCLAVCPWNRFARQSAMMHKHARPDLAAPDLCELLSLDESGFQRRFAGTPMLRTKRKGLLRNVCVALGNSRDPAARPALQRAANDPEPLIAEHARWGLEQLPE